MKRRVFDAVTFITHRYGKVESALEHQGDLRDELADAGYLEDEIERALAWLRRLRTAPSVEWSLMEPPSDVFRVASEDEARKLTASARGFLFQLERAGILDQALRETVYERAMALDVAEVDLAEAKVLVSLLLGASGRGLEELAAGVLADGLGQLYH